MTPEWIGVAIEIAALALTLSGMIFRAIRTLHTRLDTIDRRLDHQDVCVDDVRLTLRRFRKQYRRDYDARSRVYEAILSHEKKADAS